MLEVFSNISDSMITFGFVVLFSILDCGPEGDITYSSSINNEL